MHVYACIYKYMHVYCTYPVCLRMWIVRIVYCTYSIYRHKKDFFYCSVLTANRLVVDRPHHIRGMVPVSESQLEQGATSPGCVRLGDLKSVSLSLVPTWADKNCTWLGSRLGSAAYYTAVALHPSHDETSCVQPTVTTVTGGDTENGHFRYLIPSYFHIHSYTCIYVHIRAHTCFSHLVVFCPLHLHILAYTCIYLHILAYTCIYGQAGGGDSEGGMH